MGTTHLKENTVLQEGKYRIIRYIGSGGFGCTYEAVHTLMNSRVAIKEFFLRDFCERQENSNSVSVVSKSKAEMVKRLREKFLDEARAVFQLSHPNIVRVTDIFNQNDTSYYVMEYIDGQTLSQILKDKGPLEESVAVGYILQLADALRYLHSKNRLHLDIKPSNIMVDKNGKVFLIDFGASKHYDEETGENTSSIFGINTKGYAPIEQMNGSISSFSSATDIYALGATLYKLLTGVTPPTSTALISEETSLEPLPSKISPAVRQTIQKAMEPKRIHRFQNIDDFENSLLGKDTSPSTDNFENTKDGEDPKTDLDSINVSHDQDKSSSEPLLKKEESEEIFIEPLVKHPDYSQTPQETVSTNNPRKDSISGTPPHHKTSDGISKEAQPVKAKRNNTNNARTVSNTKNNKNSKPDKNRPLNTKQPNRPQNNRQKGSSKKSNKLNYLLGLVLGIIAIFVVTILWKNFGGKDKGVESGSESIPLSSDTTALGYLENDTLEASKEEVVFTAPIIPKDFVLIPGGRLNDSEWDDSKEMYVSTTYDLDSFYICRYELTQGVYREIMGELKPSNYTFYTEAFEDSSKKAFKDDQLPVLGEYEDFAKYCNRLSERDGYAGFYIIDGKSVKINPNGNGYRLPTSKEWTYAAKSGPQQDEYKYIGSNTLKEVGWYGANAQARPHPVGQLKPNSIGLYDMSGNVSELVETRPISAGENNGHWMALGGEFVYWIGYKNDRWFSPYDGTPVDNLGTRIVLVPPTIKNNNLSVMGIDEML